MKLDEQGHTMKWVLMILVILILGFAIGGCAKLTQQGDTGAQGIQGPAGETGPSGPAGMPGATGSAGAPGTSVTVVQLCPNQGQTTYGHFPEQAECIGNKLYAVYWDGTNAFLAEIVSGTYMSTSTGLQCTFVSNGCQVSQL